MSCAFLNFLNRISGTNLVSQNFVSDHFHSSPSQRNSDFFLAVLNQSSTMYKHCVEVFKVSLLPKIVAYVCHKF